MGKKAEKKRKKRISPQQLQLLLAAAWLAVLLAAASAAVYGIYRLVGHMQTRASLQSLQKTAVHDCLAAQQVLESRETAVRSWAYSLRGSGCTEAGQILDSASRGCQLIGAKRLFLVDDGYFYYGSTGLVTQLPEYDPCLQSLQTEVQTLRADGCMLVCVRVKPFTVDGATFCYALAEFDDADYQQALTLALCGGEICAEIIDSSGAELLRTTADQSLFHRLDAAQADGFASPADLKQAILTGVDLAAVCRMDGQSLILVSARMPAGDRILLTLDPAPDAPSLLSPIVVLFLALTVVLVAAAQRAFVLRLRARTLEKQLHDAQDRCASLQTSLDAAQETLRSQTAFLDMISHNIRTPLNGIVGFTSLAMRHFREPNAIQGYLEKVADASAQLLSRLNEGLDTSGWHRYVEEEASSEPAPEKTIDLTGKRILLVEDNALNRDIGEAVLTEIGMLVECAENGQEGFQKVATSRPGYYDLVLMDIQMPLMDGYEATKTIRRLRIKKLAEIPILAMTANVSREDMQKAFQSGMNGYVEKPMNIDRLLAAIQKAMNQTIGEDI